jgi:hypothetical protein
MLKFINNFYIIPIFTYTIYLIYYYFFKKYKKFRGIDTTMITHNNKQYLNIYCSSFTYNTDDIEFTNFFKKKLLTILDNYSYMRYSINKLNNTEYFYNYDKSETFINKIFYIVDTTPTYEEITKKIIDENTSILFFLSKKEKKITVANNHIFIDGINSIKLFSHLCDNRLIKKDLIPKFYYIPLLTELLICNKIPYFINNKCEMQLDFCDDWTKFDNIKSIENITNIEYVKNIKYDIEKIINKKTKFSNIIFSLIITKFLNSLIIKKKISVGLIVAFSNNYSFNNNSVINFYIYKNDNWNQLDFNNKILYVLNQIDTYLEKYGKQQAIFNYIVSNIYNYKTKKKSIDLLIANLPIQYDLKMNNDFLNLENFYLPYISFPIYSCCFTDNNKLKLFNTIRTDDIDINLFNNDNIFNETKKNV